MATEADMAADNIEKLYKNFGILADAKDNISEVFEISFTFVFYKCTNKSSNSKSLYRL